MVKTISGPISLYYLKSKDMKVILAGDFHQSLNNMCNEDIDSYKFHLFLDKYFKKTDKKIDYFLEYDFDENDISIDKNTYMKNAGFYFARKGCFSLDKDKQKKCKNIYPNINFHISDARHNKEVYEEDKSFEKMLSQFRKAGEVIEKNYEKDNYVIEKPNLFIDLVKNMKVLKNKKKIISLFNKIFKRKLIKKQLDKCDPKIRKIIKTYYKKQMDILLNGKEYNKFIEFINTKFIDDLFISKDLETLNRINERIHRIIEKIYNFLLAINAITIELYIIARMFKKTDIKSNIIIHVGEQHAINILDFLSKILSFDVISKIKPTAEHNEKVLRCLDVTKFNMEFFE